MLKRMLSIGMLVGLVSVGLGSTQVANAEAPSRIQVIQLPGNSSQSVSYSGCWSTGNFRGGTRLIRVYWNNDSSLDECFGIAPDRRIYHRWAASNWVPMPNNGRADNMLDVDGGPSYRLVQVTVNGVGPYCTTLSYGKWSTWYRC